ncbi:MAG: LicD family protein, partial [Bacteroidales bacterium]|nr:LicD family protein [Bacteroidales bacterium]
CLDYAPDQLTPKVVEVHEKLRRRVRAINNGKNFSFKSYPGFRYLLTHLYGRIYCGTRDFFKMIGRFNADMRKASSGTSGEKWWNYTEQCKSDPPSRIKTYDVAWYSETVMLPFEDMTIPCPKEYEKCLVTEFGNNWMTPLMGTSGHEGAIIDLDTPFKEFISERLASMNAWDRFWWQR